MLTIRPLLAALSLLIWASLFLSPTLASPQNRNGGGTQQTPQQQAARKPQGITKATDGSTILDTNATVNGFVLRYRISAPAQMFTTDSGVPGAAAAPGTPSPMGINVLLHGDGGQSFFAMPNQAVQDGVMGVAVLAPDPNLFWGGGSGLKRTNGVSHALAVHTLIQTVLPQKVAFNASSVFFTGVSGGSLLLSGFFAPAHMAAYAGAGVLLNCGGLAPQVPFDPAAAAALRTTRVHWQSTKQELSSLQTSIPPAIKAYEQVALGVAPAGPGMTPAQVGALQTVDNTPNGGHCAFDGKDFTSGVQLMANSYAAVMQPGGDGQVAGIGSVLRPVVGNENLVFTGSNRRSMVSTLRI